MRKLSLCCVALLVLVSLSFAQAPSPDSPEIEKNVNAVLSKMTLEQKIDLLGGINTFDVRGFPDLDLPLLHTADGPIGIRNDGPATTMAGGIGLAATWVTLLLTSEPSLATPEPMSAPLPKVLQWNPPAASAFPNASHKLWFSPECPRFIPQKPRLPRSRAA